MKKEYKKPIAEMILFDYSVAAATSHPVDPIDPPVIPAKFFSRSLDSSIDYYQKDGKLFTEDELSDFLDDETPF